MTIYTVYTVYIYNKWRIVVIWKCSLNACVDACCLKRVVICCVLVTCWHTRFVLFKLWNYHLGKWNEMHKFFLFYKGSLSLDLDNSNTVCALPSQLEQQEPIRTQIHKHVHRKQAWQKTWQSEQQQRKLQELESFPFCQGTQYCRLVEVQVVAHCYWLPP